MRLVLTLILVVQLVCFFLTFGYKKEQVAGLCMTGSKKRNLWKPLLSTGLWLYEKKEILVRRIQRASVFQQKEQKRELFEKYQAVSILDWSRELYLLSQIERFAQAGVVLFMASGISLLLSMQWQGIQTTDAGRQILARPSQWEDMDTYYLLVQGLGEKTEIEVSIPGQAEEGVSSILETAAEELAEKILGENESLDKVTGNLELPEELEGGIQVSWASSDPQLVSGRGSVSNEELEEEGSLVELTAVLSYGEESLGVMLTVHVLPPVRDYGYYLNRLTEQLETVGQEDREQPYVLLPEEVEGVAVTYDSISDNRPLFLLLLGGGAAIGVCFLYPRQIEEAYRKRNRMLQREYSKIVSQLAILLHCGLTVRGCLQRMTAEYEKEKESDSTVFSYALEEISLTYKQIAGGMQESGAYLAFGSRCGIYEYRRLGTLLEQTVRQGSSGLTGLLEQEAFWAMEQRKNLAKKRGEEAETKMMLPMFMMLGIVIVVVMVPAMMSF